MRTLLAACACIAFLAGSVPGPASAGYWKTEFAERPADHGGDIRYAILFADNQSKLQVGCVASRIERIFIVFPKRAGSRPLIAPTPSVEYAFDGGNFKAATWRLFESGTLEVPRGGESSRITRMIARSSRLQVRATGMDGSWIDAEFDLSGSGDVVPAMLKECGIQ